MTGTNVNRTIGFVRDFEYVAEVAVDELPGGSVVVKEYGHTPGGALMRAKLAAARTFGVKRRSGFYEGGFEYRTGTTGAPFAIGFA